MTQDLAALLAGRVAHALPFAERVVGLARVFEQVQPEKEGRSEVHRWPVALGLPAAAPDCVRDKAFLLPDPTSTGIVFFEDGPTIPYVFQPTQLGIKGYQSSMRLLGWINPQRLSGPLPAAYVHVLLTQALNAPAPTESAQGFYRNLTVEVQILPADVSLWNKYTLKDKDQRLLQAPYVLVGLDLTVCYTVCLDPGFVLPTATGHRDPCAFVISAPSNGLVDDAANTFTFTLAADAT